MTRLRLLPHVFVAGHRPPPRPIAYISGRALRAAIAANAALMTFAGDEAATRAPADAAGLGVPATAARGDAPLDHNAAPRRDRAA